MEEQRHCNQLQTVAWNERACSTAVDALEHAENQRSYVGIIWPFFPRGGTTKRRPQARFRGRSQFALEWKGRTTLAAGKPLRGGQQVQKL
nr:unnamed protein product [Callosobruchus chinensis]